MQPSRHRNRSLGRPTTACVLGCLLASCTVVGPTAMRNGRLAYNEAIIETENQQMLLLVVRSRYGERSNLLSVASVTANVSITASTGVELGFGDDDSYAGNLVPFGAGVTYEENPTISYTPVGGERYARQLMSPVPVGALAQLTGTRINPELIYNTLVASVNGIRNPDFLAKPTEADPRFSRFVTIMTELKRTHHLRWIEDSEQAGRFSLVIEHYAPDLAAEVQELLRLLGLSAPQQSSSRIVLPVRLALQGHEAGEVALDTRSVYDLLEILAGAVDVPERDRASGVAMDYPPPGAAAAELRIRWTEAEPDTASVAVHYRGGWFYIDDRDQSTKQFFRMLGTLLSVAMAEGNGTGASAPVLTVPVSR